MRPSRGEKYVIAGRSTHQQNHFQGTQVEALKDIHFTVEKGSTLPSWESGSGNQPFSISSYAGPADEGRVYLNNTDTSTIKNKDASSFRQEN